MRNMKKKMSDALAFGKRRKLSGRYVLLAMCLSVYGVLSAVIARAQDGEAGAPI
ncbi:hypothetical protein ABDJ41_19780 [Pedobacter sp. ASV1-7]|uniref:hypothetical protein n=1 Tax=Pedobacter sp. ASV1-7 TaxID=3145237 RepID=UPI0032E88F70